MGYGAGPLVLMSEQSYIGCFSDAVGRGQVTVVERPKGVAPSSRSIFPVLIVKSLIRGFVKEVINAPRRLGADAWHLGQVGDGGPFDGLERPEVA